MVVEILKCPVCKRLPEQWVKPGYYYQLKCAVCGMKTQKFRYPSSLATFEEQAVERCQAAWNALVVTWK